MATVLKVIEQNVINKEDIINENIRAVSAAAKFSYKASASSGLRFGYYGGTQTNRDGTRTEIADGYVTCVISKTNYIEYDFTTKQIKVNQTGFTDNNIPLYQVVTNTSAISTITPVNEVLFATFKSTEYNTKITNKTAAISTSNTNISFSIDKSFTIYNKKVDVFLKCITATSGFKVDDEVEFWTDGNIKPITLDLTNNIVKLSIINNVIKYYDSTTNTINDATSANFVFYCKVYNN